VNLDLGKNLIKIYQQTYIMKLPYNLDHLKLNISNKI